ncbi:MAG TPA: carbon-nitrogen hydrolase family protein [Anaerolineae bacterium]
MAEAIQKTFRVAAAQFAPVFLNRQATVDKACGLIARAGGEGIALLAFPESYIPAYPDWVWSVPAGDDGLLQELYAAFVANAVDVPGPETDRLCQAARQAGVFVVMGVSERNHEASGASLYNTLLYIDAQGNLLGKHRKLVPTAGERLVWAQGDGSTLAVYDTPLGHISGLICWENYMPLARYALYAWGVQVYVAATWDRGNVWLATLQHIAREGRVYVIGAGMPLRKSDIPDSYAFKQRYSADSGEWINSGDSAIVGPDGEFTAGPLREAEGFVCAEINLTNVQGSKWMLDVAGHYGRPDVFQLTVLQDARSMLNTQ